MQCIGGLLLPAGAAMILLIFGFVFIHTRLGQLVLACNMMQMPGTLLFGPFWVDTWLQSVLVSLTVIVSVLMASLKPSHASLVGALGLGCVLVFTADNWVVLFFCYELCMVPMVLLVTCFGAQLERIQATLWLMVYAMVFSVPMFVVLLGFVAVNGLDFDQFRLAVLPWWVGLW